MESNHKVAHVVSVLSNLNVQRNTHTELCDIELIMTDGTLHAHKAVLVTGSKYFEAMFSHGSMVENIEGKIDLRFTCEVMKAMLSYIYLGKIDISEDNFLSRLEAAQYLQIDGVVESCCEFMVTSLSSNNYGDYLLETSRLSLKDTEEEIKTFIENNICLEFVKENEDQYWKLPFDYVYQLLDSENPQKVKSEYEVFQLARLWAQGEQEHHTSQDECIKLLHDCIRYPLIKLKDLTDHVIPYMLEMNDSRLFKLVLEAQTYHLRPDKHINQYAEQPNTTMRFFTYGIVTLPRKGGWHLNLWKHPIEESDPVQTARAPDYIGANAAIAEMDGFIFVAGGQISNTNKGYTTMQRYNPRNNTWFTCQSMQQGRYNFSLTPMNGKLYAVGGETSSYTGIANVECYDVKRNKWEEVKSLTSAVYNHRAAVIDRKLYIIGGDRGAIQTYDPLSNKWECLIEEKSLETSYSKRVHHVCFLKNTLYILLTDSNLDIQKENLKCFSIAKSKMLSSTSLENSATLIVSYEDSGKLRIVGKPKGNHQRLCTTDELLDIKVVSEDMLNATGHAQRVKYLILYWNAIESA